MRSVARGPLVVAVVLGALVLPASAASAAVPSGSVLDQSFVADVGFGAPLDGCCRSVAQTFTAGLSGELTAVAVDVEALPGTTGTLRIAVRAVDFGPPIGPDLASVSLDGPSSRLDNVVQLPVGVPVVARHRYAIIVSLENGVTTQQGLVRWLGPTGILYPGGDLFEDDPQQGWIKPSILDAHFQTYVHPACNGRLATIVGSAGDDALFGTSGADVIVSLGGDDSIIAGDGDDLICSGGGDDAIQGNGGADRVFAGPGADVVAAGGGPDVVNGQRGPDFLAGNTGDDVLIGEFGRDALVGDDGTDACYGGRGIDQAGECEKTAGIP